MTYSTKILAFLLVGFILPAQLHAAIWIRVNQAGYAPQRTKSVVVLSDTEIAGQSWTVTQNGRPVLQGSLPAAIPGDQIHVAQRFSYAVDLSAVREPGRYVLAIQGAQSAAFQVLDDPYSLFATQALMHLRAMRSGSPDARLHGVSHLGDSAAIVHAAKGEWTKGVWQAASPHKTVDMRGGHYDAGDYVKFTLNESYLAWHLLTAYQENPALFPRVFSSVLPDILDEARHSLEYLARTYPEPDLFVIQVGDRLDHQQGWRMPESDALNGRRPALCALSRVHMGSAAAALALGATVFHSLDSAAAARYREKAIAIYARARQNDTQRSAFERDAANDFYWDDTDADNMALAAAELYRLTQENAYLEQARVYAPAAGYEVSWGAWNFQANHLLAKLGDAAAATRAALEVSRYEDENIWQVPGNYTWGTLHRWIGMGNAHFRAGRDLKTPAAASSAVFEGVLDYVFGRNNWGVSMLASADLPNSIRNIYNGIYRLSEAFPTGALSEGPGDLATHMQMRSYFSVPLNDPLEEFNTQAAVFYDNRDDFMIQESTIGGQSDLLLMLALASAKNVQPRTDSGTVPTSLYLEPDSLQAFPAAQLGWITYNDQSEGGNSVVTTPRTSGVSVDATLDTRANTTLGYAYSGLQGTFPAALRKTGVHGIRLVMNLKAGAVVRVNLAQSNIKDYGYHGKDILGKGQGSYWIDFSSVSQAYGQSVSLDASKLTALDMVNNMTGQKLEMRVDSVIFYSYADKPPYSTSLLLPAVSRGPSLLRLERQGKLFYLHPARQFEAESLMITDAQGKIQARLYRNAQGSFVWNTRAQPAGLYWVRASQSGSVLMLRVGAFRH